MVSHSQRLSKIEFASYWTKTFDYYGVTKSKDDPSIAEVAAENESVFGDPDFIVVDKPAKMIRIET